MVSQYVKIIFSYYQNVFIYYLTEIDLNSREIKDLIFYSMNLTQIFHDF